MRCFKTFIWKAAHHRHRCRQHWFRLWVTESYSIRQLSTLSGYSISTIRRIKDYWLPQIPKESHNYAIVKYVIYDATYFHKDGCLINIMNADNQTIIAHTYVHKENFKDVHPWLLELKGKGLNPYCVTMDGERSIIRALKLAWPHASLQRCLYHIQHEGLRWLRTYPKTQAGRDLRFILMKLSSIKTIKDRNFFIRTYRNWLNQYRDFVMSLPRSTVAFKDLKRTIVLINNALPDMFRYLNNSHIQSTTNALEGFHSRLKTDYQRHRGLVRQHRVQYINWYCYFKNQKISNT